MHPQVVQSRRRKDVNKLNKPQRVSLLLQTVLPKDCREPDVKISEDQGKNPVARLCKENKSFFSKSSSVLFRHVFCCDKETVSIKKRSWLGGGYLLLSSH